jgi:hypothetical protein
MGRVTVPQRMGDHIPPFTGEIFGVKFWVVLHKNIRLKWPDSTNIMLPTFVSELEHVKKALLDSFYVSRSKAKGFAGDLPQRYYEEGDKHGNSKPGQEDDSREFKRFEGNMSKTREESMLLTKEEIVGIWSDLGRKFGEQIQGALLTEMEDVTTRYNQVVEKRQGETLEDQIYRVIESTMVGFDANGNITSTFIASSEMEKKLQAAMERVEADPVLKAKFDAQRARKYEEFRDREANRRLVD